MTTIDLSGQTILITGAAGNGIAAGICKILHQSGAKLIINDCLAEKVDEVVNLYPGSFGVVADISSANAIEGMFAYIDKNVGKIDGLVNNAGVGLNKRAHQASVDEFDRLYDIDVRGLWMMSKAFINQLIKHNKTGNIINVSSVHSHSTTAGYAIYASAKAAVDSLTRGMAIEVGKLGIRVNSIAPGYVHAEQNFKLIGKWTEDPQQWINNHATDQQALPHQIDNIDVGYSVAFYLSNLSRSITGQTIIIDNGMTSMLYNNKFFAQQNEKNSQGVSA
ncbi:MAG: SDR family oxidoreductase [Thalassotalea sp.]|nr:SDR family oxidoreductase [Thalassotalea sp.]